jgi:ABC-type amino acid transport substrate-binding protein
MDTHSRVADLKGRFLGVVLGSVGQGRLKRAFENAVKAIETRADGASPQ